MSLFNRTTNNFTVTALPATLKEGDMLILQSERRVSREVLDRLRAQLADTVPGARLIILEAGLKIGTIISAEDIERWEGEGGR